MRAAMGRAAVEGYLRLLLEQIDKNRKINELAKHERDAIAAGNIALVMEGDAIRNEIIEQLHALRAEMDPYLQELPVKLGCMPAQLKNQIVTVSTQLEEIIKETIAIDRENEINLQKFKQGIGDRVKEIGKGKQALSGYKSPSQKKPKLFNGRA
jgi:hypothetical protein